MSSPSVLIAFFAVVRKEVFQTLRDRRIMFMLIAAPLLQTVVLGYAIDFNIDQVPTVTVNEDSSALSRQHQRRLLADKTLRFVGDVENLQVATELLRNGKAAAALVLPKNFAREEIAGRPSPVQVLMDGTDPNRARVVADAVSRYFAEDTRLLLQARLAATGKTPPPSIQAIPQVLYNPELLTGPFMIPGVMTMLLVITTTIVTAMGLSREREMGTLEQVLVTPIAPWVLLLGKMVPFFAIGLFDVLLVLTAGVWLFQVPVVGTFGVLFTGTFLYLLSTLGMGLLISTISHTQQQSFLAGFLFAMPAILLSGVMTPIRAMPAWIQTATLFNPVRHYVEILRACLLKGATILDLWPAFLALAFLGVGLFLTALLRFHKRVV
jgi:ABC-2 type transport system permease protein